MSKSARIPASTINRIKKLTEAGWTLQKVANACDVSVSTASRHRSTGWLAKKQSATRGRIGG